MSFKGIHLASLVNITIPDYVSCCVFSTAVGCQGTTICQTLFSPC